jgi:hypothetical protein
MWRRKLRRSDLALVVPRVAHLCLLGDMPGAYRLLCEVDTSACWRGYFAGLASAPCFLCAGYFLGGWLWPR